MESVEPRKKTSSLFGRLSTLFNYDIKNARLMREDFHEGTIYDKLINLYCATCSSLIFGIAIGCAFLLYWKYNNDFQIITLNEFAYCVVILLICDLFISTLGPLLIAWYGYGPLAIAADIWRVVMLFCAWTYFLPNPPLPHYMFTFFIGAPVLCCPLFLIGATCVDSWLFARYPQYRLIGNFVPGILSVNGVGIASISLLVIKDPNITLCAMATFCAFLTILEIYFYVFKGYFHEPHDDTFTLSDFASMMGGFFTTELLMKAWTSDAVLALTWVSFSWYYPIFYVENETVEDIALGVVASGCLSVVCGMASVIVVFIYYTWGITEDEKLVNLLLKGHIVYSWISKGIYVLGLLITPLLGGSWRVKLWARLFICGFALGQGMVTPNSMIMILSVSPNEIIPYTGFAQISFISVAYGGSLWLNFYADKFQNFATAYAILITVLGTLLMGLLTAWILYEVYCMNAQNPRFSIRRKTTGASITMPEIPKMLVAMEQCSKSKNGKMSL